MGLPDDTRDYLCTTCSKTFGRAEHLRRHELTHSSQDKPFKCSSCAKGFIRRDALQRHELTHQAPPNLLQRGGRACSACVIAKARCSGGLQCTRCQHKNIQCVNPDMLSPLSLDHTPADRTPQPQNVFTSASSISGQRLHSTDPSMIDYEAWEQNMLAATNWLDVSYNADYSTFAFTPMPFDAPSSLAQQHFAPPVEHLNFLGPACTQPNVASASIPTASPASVVSLQSTVLTGSHISDICNDTQEVGEFYVDGETARLPRVKRRKTSTSTSQPTPHFRSHAAVVFSLDLPADIVNSSSETTIQPDTYSEIQDAYHRFCIQPPAPWTAFENVQLPNVALLETLKELYFKHFDQVLPFINQINLTRSTNCGILVLAIAAVGAQYLDETPPFDFCRSMHEFVRRWLVYLHELPQWEDKSSWPIRSAQLLNLLSMAYHGDEYSCSAALENSHWLPKIFAKASSRAVTSRPSARDGGSEEYQWLTWCERESNIRLAYSAWLVDAMMSYHLNYEPRMTLRDCSLPLPCSERLWTASTAQQWKDAYDSRIQQPTLNETLKIMYIEKRLARDTGEFARVLLVHGLFQRQWEVEAYLLNPLSHWEPTAKRQPASDLPTFSPWLPSIPTFTRWQNSACDCLDILHWQANATIGQASGLEHPTVMHLHLARIVLLTPHKDIVALARQMVNLSTSRDNAAMVTKQQLIRRWAVQHQYKARLAAVHAGVTLWHIRRYSVDGFYEAPAVALAALVLWAFGTFSTSTASSSSPTAEQQQEESEQSDDTGCSIILLDRPTDDELVQQFIRNGGSMQAHISGVGDLYASKGPERVLAQGCKLLSLLKVWGVASSWQRLLQGLVDVLRERRSTAPS